MVLCTSQSLRQGSFSSLQPKSHLVVIARDCTCHWTWSMDGLCHSVLSTPCSSTWDKFIKHFVNVDVRCQESIYLEFFISSYSTKKLIHCIFLNLYFEVYYKEYAIPSLYQFVVFCNLVFETLKMWWWKLMGWGWEELQTMEMALLRMLWRCNKHTLASYIADPLYVFSRLDYIKKIKENFSYFWLAHFFRAW